MDSDGRTVVEVGALFVSCLLAVSRSSSSAMKPTLVRWSDMPGRECAGISLDVILTAARFTAQEVYVSSVATRHVVSRSPFAEPLVGRQVGYATERNCSVQCDPVFGSSVVSWHSPRRLAISPFQSRAAPKLIQSYLFNGYRRLAGQAPYFVIPFALGASFASSPVFCP